MNGWQRLWLVLTAVVLLGYGVFYPFVYVGENVLGRYYYEERYNLLKDLESPQCSQYAAKPLNSLVKPEWGEGGTCYYLYQARKYDDSNTIPFTIEAFDRQKNRQYYEYLFGTMAATSVITLVCAGLVYFAGFLTAWIRRGFAKAA